MHRHCFRFLLRHLHFSGEMANNDYGNCFREMSCVIGFVQVENLHRGCVSITFVCLKKQIKQRIGHTEEMIS